MSAATRKLKDGERWGLTKETDNYDTPYLLVHDEPVTDMDVMSLATWVVAAKLDVPVVSYFRGGSLDGSASESTFVIFGEGCPDSPIPVVPFRGTPTIMLKDPKRAKLFATLGGKTCIDHVGLLHTERDTVTTIQMYNKKIRRLKKPHGQRPKHKT